MTDRSQVNRSALVGLTPFRDNICLHRILEADEFLVLRAVIFNLNASCVHKDNLSLTLCHDLCTWVTSYLRLNTSTHNRSICTYQRNSLAHHVWSHQSTVRIIVLQERNQRSRNRSDLLRSHIHQIHFRWSNYREVSTITSLNSITHEMPLIIQGRISLGNGHFFLLLCSIILQTFWREINLSILHFTIRSRNKAQIIDLRIDTQRRDQTDVRTLRCLNRTQTTIMRIVYVSYLETSTITRQTSRT